jgi:hypothetical protein
MSCVVDVALDRQAARALALFELEPERALVTGDRRLRPRHVRRPEDRRDRCEYQQHPVHGQVLRGDRQEAVASRLPHGPSHGRRPECGAGGTTGVDPRTSSCAIARPGALAHQGGELLGGHVDAVTLQAAIKLKPREAQEHRGARLVTVRALERVDDRVALEVVQRHGGGRRPRRFGWPR